MVSFLENVKKIELLEIENFKSEFFKLYIKRIEKKSKIAIENEVKIGRLNF